MAWGDSWGHSAWSYHEKFAKAFFEGRERGSVSKGTYVCRGPWKACFMEYRYGRNSLARYTPPSMMAEAVARKLKGEEVEIYPMMEFCCNHRDKAEARHLQGLGVEARWQWGGHPFLAFGVDISDGQWRTIEECKAAPKWIKPVKPVKPLRPDRRFVNLTLPLFT